MEIEELRNIISRGENEFVEFKTSFNKEVIETVVAFSNYKGGKIFIGINDKPEIKGAITTPESIQTWMNDIKQHTEPSIFPEIEQITYNHKVIVLIRVNEYPLKPVAYKDRYFIRRNNSNHKLTIDEIAEMRFNLRQKQLLLMT